MSSKYMVNWALSGFRSLEHKAGDVIEAVEHEAEEIATLVKTGVLTLIKKVEGAGDEIDTATASTDDLVAYTKEKFGFELDPSLSKDAMLAEIASLESGDGSSEESTGAPTDLSTLTKVQLVAYAKDHFNYDLKPNLSKDAMLAEIASLEKK
jgi:hypothetical protein